MLNSFGESIPPCITPILIYLISLFTCSAVYPYNHLIVLISSSEYFLYLSSSNSFKCGTLSNAFCMSRWIVAIILFLNALFSFQYCIFYCNFSKLISHPNPFENPTWFLLFLIICLLYFSSYSIL